MSTLIPVRAALLTLTSALGLPDGAVGRGQFGTYIADEQFLLGAANAGEPNAETSWVPANVGLPSIWDEAFDVQCEIRTAAGDVDIDTREIRAEALFDTYRAAVLADQSLGGLVLRAYISDATLTSGMTTGGGSAAEVRFTVHVINQT